MTESGRSIRLCRRIRNSFLRKSLNDSNRAGDQTDSSKDSFKLPAPKPLLPAEWCEKYLEILVSEENGNDSRKSRNRSIIPRKSNPTENIKHNDIFPTSTPMKMSQKRNTLLLTPIMSPINKTVSKNEEKMIPSSTKNVQTNDNKTKNAQTTPLSNDENKLISPVISSLSKDLTEKRRSSRLLKSTQNSERNTAPQMADDNVQNKNKKLTVKEPKITVLSDLKFAKRSNSKHAIKKKSTGTISEDEIAFEVSTHSKETNLVPSIDENINKADASPKIVPPKKRGRKKKNALESKETNFAIGSKETPNVELADGNKKENVKIVKKRKPGRPKKEVKRLEKSTVSYKEFRKLFPDVKPSEKVRYNERPKRTVRQAKQNQMLVLLQCSPGILESPKKNIRDKKKTIQEQREKSEGYQVDSDRNTDSGIFDNPSVRPTNSQIIQSESIATRKDIISERNNGSTKRVKANKKKNLNSKRDKDIKLTNNVEHENNDILNVDEVDNLQIVTTTENINMDNGTAGGGEVTDNAEVIDPLRTISYENTRKELFPKKRKSVIFHNAGSKRLMRPERTTNVNSHFQTSRHELFPGCIREPNFVRFQNCGDIEVARMMKADNVSFGFLKIVPGGTKSESFLRSVSMSFLVISGVAELFFNNQTIIFKKLNRIYVPKGSEYSIRNVSTEEELLMEFSKISK